MTKANFRWDPELAEEFDFGLSFQPFYKNSQLKYND